MLRNYLVPFTEILASGDLSFMDTESARQIYERRVRAEHITTYFRTAQDSGGMTEAKLEYYRAIAALLQDPDYRRILLYLPLSDLKDAPDLFRQAYLNAWYSLLHVQDARENFYEGDTFEVEARPDGKLERIVKCAHLTPWLIEAGYLDYRDLVVLLHACTTNEVLMRSFANVMRLISDRQLLSAPEVESLCDMTSTVQQRKRIEPLFVSKKRRDWLESRKNQSLKQTLLTPRAMLTGPFSANLPALAGELEEIQAKLGPHDIALVGGSRLKGYGTTDSDLDVFSLNELNNDKEMCGGSPHAAHLYFNSVWIGGDKVMDLREIATEKAIAYYSAPDRRMSVERLESDLLQYRLLHKGYQRFTGEYKSLAKGYSDLDGDCPFYDEGYRRIATELYAKYVFIPKQRKTAR